MAQRSQSLYITLERCSQDKSLSKSTPFPPSQFPTPDPFTDLPPPTDLAKYGADDADHGARGHFVAHRYAENTSLHRPRMFEAINDFVTRSYVITPYLCCPHFMHGEVIISSQTYFSFERISTQSLAMLIM